MAREYVKKMNMSTTVNPYLTVSTADTEAQVIFLGHNHLEKVGLNNSCLHRTETLMYCINDTAMGAMGVIFGCIRGKSAVTRKTLCTEGWCTRSRGISFYYHKQPLRTWG